MRANGMKTPATDGAATEDNDGNGDGPATLRLPEWDGVVPVPADAGHDEALDRAVTKAVELIMAFGLDDVEVMRRLSTPVSPGGDGLGPRRLTSRPWPAGGTGSPVA